MDHYDSFSMIPQAAEPAPMTFDDPNLLTHFGLPWQRSSRADDTVDSVNGNRNGHGFGHGHESRLNRDDSRNQSNHTDDTMERMDLSIPFQGSFQFRSQNR